MSTFTPLSDQLEQLLTALQTLVLGLQTTPPIKNAMGGWPDQAYFQEDGNLPSVFFLLTGTRNITTRKRHAPYVTVDNGDGTMTQYIETSKGAYLMDLHTVAGTRQEAMDISAAVRQGVEAVQDVPLPDGINNSLAIWRGDSVPYKDQSLNVYHRSVTFEFQLRNLMAATGQKATQVVVGTTVENPASPTPTEVVVNTTVQ